MSELRELQTLFVAAIRNENPEAVENMPIHETAQASKAVRLGVYAYAYRQRILDSLAEDFPVTFENLGENAIHTVREFVKTQRTGVPSLGEVSRLFFEFLSHARPDLKSDLSLDYAFLLAGLEDWSLKLQSISPLTAEQLASSKPQNVRALWNHSLRVVGDTLIFQKNGLLESAPASPHVLSLLQQRKTISNLEQLLIAVEHMGLTPVQTADLVHFLTRNELLIWH